MMMKLPPKGWVFPAGVFKFTEQKFIGGLPYLLTKYVSLSNGTVVIKLDLPKVNTSVADFWDVIYLVNLAQYKARNIRHLVRIELKINSLPAYRAKHYITWCTLVIYCAYYYSSLGVNWSSSIYSPNVFAKGKMWHKVT